jgi:predicted Zn-dependent protease
MTLRTIWVLSVIILISASCQKVPITGRSQLHGFPESEMIALSKTQYQEVLQKSKVVSGTPDAALVNTVGAKISAAAQKLMTQLKEADRLAGYAWEYHLLENSEPNAWCLPGGKIAVYTGILPITKDESGLAVVIGHEVGHAIAQHGNERMSQQMAAQLGSIGLDYALANKTNETKQIYEAAYGYGAQYGVLLPYSRTQESEADKIGMALMAIAGYDPNAAIALWERMASMSHGPTIPEFMSTHPSDEHRIQDIKKFLPEAMKYYNKK